MNWRGTDLRSPLRQFSSFSSAPPSLEQPMRGGFSAVAVDGNWEGREPTLRAVSAVGNADERGRTTDENLMEWAGKADGKDGITISSSDEGISKEILIAFLPKVFEFICIISLQPVRWKMEMREIFPHCAMALTQCLLPVRSHRPQIPNCTRPISKTSATALMEAEMDLTICCCLPGDFPSPASIFLPNWTTGTGANHYGQVGEVDDDGGEGGDDAGHLLIDEHSPPMSAMAQMASIGRIHLLEKGTNLCQSFVLTHSPIKYGGVSMIELGDGRGESVDHLWLRMTANPTIQPPPLTSTPIAQQQQHNHQHHRWSTCTTALPPDGGE
ncbi:hypothetical protein GPALN_013053 [Globodera pallida]|nr:hypothetical protein GPALN_013053 [Globodera pallida]